MEAIVVDKDASRSESCSNVTLLVDGVALYVEELRTGGDFGWPGSDGSPSVDVLLSELSSVDLLSEEKCEPKPGIDEISSVDEAGPGEEEVPNRRETADAMSDHGRSGTGLSTIKLKHTKSFYYDTHLSRVQLPALVCSQTRPCVALERIMRKLQA